MTMSHASTRYQRGQAMSEFVAAMALFLPLLLGLIYVGKYSDIKHQTIQASRFAAFERALDPSKAHESDTVLQEETRARFFMDESTNQGALVSTTNNQATAGTLNPLWSQMNGDPMLDNYTNVALTYGAEQKVDDATLAPVDAANTLLFGLNSNGQFQANVEVSPPNIASFGPLSAVNLKIAASTVVVGDAWNAGGAASVASRLTGGTPGSMPIRPGGPVSSIVSTILNISNTVLQPFYQALAGDSGPQLGCIRPDVVPANTAPGANYQPGDTCY
jgi:Flp pilus assembly protein TadG